MLNLFLALLLDSLQDASSNEDDHSNENEISSLASHPKDLTLPQKFYRVFKLDRVSEMFCRCKNKRDHQSDIEQDQISNVFSIIGDISDPTNIGYPRSQSAYSNQDNPMGHTNMNYYHDHTDRGDNVADSTFNTIPAISKNQFSAESITNKPYTVTGDRSDNLDINDVAYVKDSHTMPDIANEGHSLTHSIKQDHELHHSLNANDIANATVCMEENVVSSQNVNLEQIQPDKTVNGHSLHPQINVKRRQNLFRRQKIDNESTNQIKRTNVPLRVRRMLRKRSAVNEKFANGSVDDHSNEQVGFAAKNSHKHGGLNDNNDHNLLQKQYRSRKLSLLDNDLSATLASRDAIIIIEEATDDNQVTDKDCDKNDCNHISVKQQDVAASKLSDPNLPVTTLDPATIKKDIMQGKITFVATAR